MNQENFQNSSGFREPILVQPAQKNNKTVLMILICALIFLIIAGGTVIYFYTDLFNPAKTVEPSFSSTPSLTASPSPSASPSLLPGQISVQWYEDLILDSLKKGEGQYYETGRILNGEYTGQILYLKAIEQIGVFFSHVVFDGGREQEISNIKGIDDLPERISIPGSEYALKKGNTGNLFKDDQITKRLFTDQVLGDAYKNALGCIVFQLPDKTAFGYSLVLPFIDSSGKLAINFNDGQTNTEEYVYISPSCSSECENLATISGTEIDESKLIISAKAENGAVFYEFKDSNEEFLKKIYNDKNTVAYFNNGSFSDKSRYTYQQFSDYNPVLFWKDPFGRWIQFKNKRFDTMAEMCKPVIYLYPEEKTQLSLQVAPNGGIYNSEPAYNGGWSVLADPNGKITDLKTGKQYDSLLWEGYGLHYPEITSGWVVKKAEISKFLDEKLSVLGLNKKEISDFKAYWVERLSEKPYYEITFLDKRQIDELAPLSFSTSPDNIIRVIMTAKGLDAPISILEPKLPLAPQRNGFSVVEWGGALLK